MIYNSYGKLHVRFAFPMWRCPKAGLCRRSILYLARPPRWQHPFARHNIDFFEANAAIDRRVYLMPAYHQRYRNQMCGYLDFRSSVCACTLLIPCAYVPPISLRQSLFFPILIDEIRYRMALRLCSDAIWKKS